MPGASQQLLEHAWDHLRASPTRKAPASKARPGPGRSPASKLFLAPIPLHPNKPAMEKVTTASDRLTPKQQSAWDPSPSECRSLPASSSILESSAEGRRDITPAQALQKLRCLLVGSCFYTSRALDRRALLLPPGPWICPIVLSGKETKALPNKFLPNSPEHLSFGQR